MSQDTPLTWYDRHAANVAAAFEALDPDELHGWMRDLLPEAPGLVLDVGAGTGRDTGRFRWIRLQPLPTPRLRSYGSTEGMRATSCYSDRDAGLAKTDQPWV